ncbi:putative peroxisomal acyl-coenzyme A oxidase [Toxocara canis]|uniref:Acyl-coenzyme A oxidase n=1 Tax=Toxocara canis TaxID=6265 RepID=A0A0B2V165_TOXCA|nr:putative peroxisomal acyl-coenzyme A oxidase [Toxocara canis]
MRRNLVEEGDNPDITMERRKATFSVDKMAMFIHGGEYKLRRRREILKFVESQPEFQDPIPPEFMSRQQRLENNARKVVAMTDKTEVIDQSDFFEEGMYYQSLIMGRDLHPMSLHYVMFIPTLQGQTDDEQLNHWLPLAVSRSIIGTYAQTELGHGTNLSKLETTATYDPATDEFILHTPSISAAKWWPGGLGKSSNYAIVVAQLITQNEGRGPHPFIVQIRDHKTHKPIKGVTVGDIGPKLGINGNDNGFLVFDSYRIPRQNMLMRYSKVLPNGEYVAPSHAKLGYGAMVFVRSAMIRDQAMQIAAAVVIAIRYSAIRRQGEITSGMGEVQILDYRTQQYRVMPQLAKALVFLFAATQVKELFQKVTAQLTGGNTELLQELHVLSSGLKAVVSWEVAQGVEQCRLACGGHGYSQASAFPEIYAYAVGGCTYEGENIVMLLQVARFLMKAAENVRAGNARLAAIAGYLNEKGPMKCKLTSWRMASDADLIENFEYVARKQVFAAFDFLQELQRGGQSAEDAWNSCSVELCKASRMHVKCYLVKTYLEKISQCNDPELRPPLNLIGRLFIFDQMAAHMGAFRKMHVKCYLVKTYLEKISQCNDPELRPPLNLIGRLFIFDQMAAHMGAFRKAGFMEDSQAESISRAIYDILTLLRPNAVALADSLDFSDRELHSVLGRRDGNVYPALLKWAQQSQLNQTEVLPTFDKFLGPMMNDARSKL